MAIQVRGDARLLDSAHGRGAPNALHDLYRAGQDPRAFLNEAVEEGGLRPGSDGMSAIWGGLLQPLIDRYDAAPRWKKRDKLAEVLSSLEPGSTRSGFTLLLHAAVTEGITAATASKDVRAVRAALPRLKALLGRSLTDWVRTRDNIAQAKETLERLSPQAFFAAVAQLKVPGKEKLFFGNRYRRTPPYLIELTEQKALALAESVGLADSLSNEIRNHMFGVWRNANC